MFSVSVNTLELTPSHAELNYTSPHLGAPSSEWNRCAMMMMATWCECSIWPHYFCRTVPVPLWLSLSNTWSKDYPAPSFFLSSPPPLLDILPVISDPLFSAAVTFRACLLCSGDSSLADLWNTQDIEIFGNLSPCSDNFFSPRSSSQTNLVSCDRNSEVFHPHTV